MTNSQKQAAVVALGIVVILLLGLLLVTRGSGSEAQADSAARAASGTGANAAVESGEVSSHDTIVVREIAMPQENNTPTSRVEACGTRLCIDGTPWFMNAGAIYKGYDRDPAAAIEVAIKAGANTIRVTDFFNPSTEAYTSVADEATWRRLDQVIAYAGRKGLYVILDISPFRNRLVAEDKNPYIQNWKPMLKKSANRINTVTGVAYKDDPTIALMSVAGEPDNPEGQDKPTRPTQKQLEDFFAESLNYWHKLAPKTLGNTGGLTGALSGEGGESLLALKNNAVCSIHVYTEEELENSMRYMAEKCKKLGKPWILEETGAAQGIGDEERATWFDRIFANARDLGYSGVGIWNFWLDELPNSCDVNDKTPLAQAAVKEGFTWAAQ